MPADEMVQEVVEPVEAQETPEQQEPQGDPQEADLIEVAGAKQDGRVAPHWLRSLKETDPKAYKDATALFYRDRDTQKLLDGFDAKGTRAWLDEKGGREAYEQTFADAQGKAQEYDGLLESIRSGDGSFATQLMETAGEHGPAIGFAVMNALAKSHPEAYSSALGGVFDATLSSSPLTMGFQRVDMNMGMLADILNDQSIPDNVKLAQVISTFNRVQGEFKPMREFITSFRQQPGQQAAQTTPRGNPKVDQRSQELDRRETEMYNRDVRRDVDSFRREEITKHLKTLPGYDKASKDDIEDAIRATINDVNEQMGKDDAYQRSLNGYDAKRDMTGKLRTVKSRESKAIEQIAPRWGKRLFAGQTAAPKPPVTPTAQRTSAPNRTTPDPFRAILDSAMAR